MNFKKVPETSYNITLTPFLIVQNMTVAYDTATNLVQAIRSAPQVYQQAALRSQNVTSNNLPPMPPHVLMNFRGFPPGCADSVADF